MAKTLTKAQMEPINKILDIKMNEELEALNSISIEKKLKEQEEENLKVIAKTKTKIDQVNVLIKEINKELSKTKSGVRYNSINEIKANPINVYASNGSSNYYNGRYYGVTPDQMRAITIDLEKKKLAINFKYEGLRAKIMLADNFESINNILKQYGLGFDDSFDEAAATKEAI